MFAASVSKFESSLVSGESALSPDSVTRHLRTGLLLLMAVVAIAFLMAGCAWQPVAFGSAAVVGLAFAPKLRAYGSRFHYSLGSAVSGILVATMVMGVAGCSASQKQTVLQVVQEINKYAPTVESALDGAAASIAALDPAVAGAVMVGVTGFDVLSKVFNASLSAYLANPNATTLQALQAAINSLEVSVNTATFNAVGIKDAASSALALAILKGILTVASYVFTLIAQTEATAQLNDVRALIKVPAIALRKHMDEAQLRQFARDQGVPKMLAGWSVDQAFDQAAAAGF